MPSSVGKYFRRAPPRAGPVPLSSSASQRHVESVCLHIEHIHVRRYAYCVAQLMSRSLQAELTMCVHDGGAAACERVGRQKFLLSLVLVSTMTQCAGASKPL